MHGGLLKCANVMHSPVAERHLKWCFAALQAEEQSALRQRAAGLEGLLSVSQMRNADLAAELAKTPFKWQPAAKAGAGADADADSQQLACLQGNLAALAQCSLGQLYRSADFQAASKQDKLTFIKVKITCVPWRERAHPLHGGGPASNIFHCCDV